MPGEIKILRPTVGVRVLFIAIYLIGIVLWTIRFHGNTLAISLFVSLGALAVLDVLSTQIRVQENGIFVVDHFRRRTISRADITEVSWVKGGGTYLKLNDGKIIRLPGSNPQGQTNTIRAWLNKTAPTP